MDSKGKCVSARAMTPPINELEDAECNTPSSIDSNDFDANCLPGTFNDSIPLYYINKNDPLFELTVKKLYLQKRLTDLFKNGYSKGANGNSINFRDMNGRTITLHAFALLILAIMEELNDFEKYREMYTCYIHLVSLFVSEQSGRHIQIPIISIGKSLINESYVLNHIIYKKSANYKECEDIQSCSIKELHEIFIKLWLAFGSNVTVPVGRQVPKDQLKYVSIFDKEGLDALKKALHPDYHEQLDKVIEYFNDIKSLSVLFLNETKQTINDTKKQSVQQFTDPEPNKTNTYASVTTSSPEPIKPIELTKKWSEMSMDIPMNETLPIKPNEQIINKKVIIVKPSNKSKGTEQTISSKGTEQTISSKGTGQTISSKGTEQTISSKGTEQTISSKGTEQTISSKGTEQTISCKGTEQTISCKGTEQTISCKGTGQTISCKQSKESESEIERLKESESEIERLKQQLKESEHKILGLENYINQMQQNHGHQLTVQNSQLYTQSEYIRQLNKQITELQSVQTASFRPFLQPKEQKEQPEPNVKQNVPFYIMTDEKEIILWPMKQQLPNVTYYTFNSDGQLAKC